MPTAVNSFNYNSFAPNSSRNLKYQISTALKEG